MRTFTCHEGNTAEGGSRSTGQQHNHNNKLEMNRQGNTVTRSGVQCIVCFGMLTSRT